MKAVAVLDYGGPDVLRVVDVPDPRAGSGQIRLRVHAAAVNPADTLLRVGDIDAVLAGNLDPPYRPGMDAAGIVDEIGPDTRPICGWVTGRWRWSCLSTPRVALTPNMLFCGQIKSRLHRREYEPRGGVDAAR